MVLNNNSKNFIIKLNKVCKFFGGIKAVDNVSLEFEKGKIIGLIGPNGAGKTTIFNLISGFYRPDKGEIFFNEIRIDGLPPYKIAQLGIGRLFQDVRIFSKLTVLENIMVAFSDPIGEKFYNSLFKFKKLQLIEKQKEEKAKELLEFVELINLQNVLAENLSYGQQKLLSIARLLAMGSEVLLLDEPTSGVHPKLIAKITNLIKKMANQGKTIIFIEHDVNIILEIADWLYLIDEGKVITSGLPHQVLSNKLTKEIYLGI